MVRAIDEGPQSSRRFRIACFASEQASTDPEQDPPAQLQPFGLGRAPWKWFEQGQPRIFELRQFEPCHPSRQKRGLNRLQARFRRRIFSRIESLKPLAPPRKPDHAEVRIAAGRHNIGEGQIEVPEREESGSNARWQLLERGLAICVEPSLSDR